MRLFQSFAHVLVDHPRAVLDSRWFLGDLALLRRAQRRHNDPMVPVTSQQPGDLRARQPTTAAQEVLQVIEPQHTPFSLSSLPDRDGQPSPAGRGEQHMAGQCRCHRLIGSPGLARSRVADKQHEPAPGEAFPKLPINVARHIRRHSGIWHRLTGLYHCGPGWCAGMHTQRDRVTDLLNPRQPTRGKDQTAFLDLH